MQASPKHITDRADDTSLAVAVVQLAVQMWSVMLIFFSALASQVSRFDGCIRCLSLPFALLRIP